MRIRTFLILLITVVMATSAAMALNGDDELWIPAAARGAGLEGSFWMTDLTIMNGGEEDVTVEVAWLARNRNNIDAEGEMIDIAAGETVVFEDVIMSLFGEETATGAIHIEVVEEKDDEEGDEEDEDFLVATARIYNLDGGETFGQGFEGMISDAAISDEEQEPTHVIGVTDNDAFRSNWYGLNLTEDEEDGWEEGEVLVEVLDLDGEVLASDTFTMQPLAPVLFPVSDLGAGDFDNGVLRFTMLEGEGIFGASKVDGESNDPTTLESHWECESEDDLEFTADFMIENCTFATTGRNPFFILESGFELVLEGEDDGEEISVTITVLDETFMVDGVECRVVEEYETEDGELVEISRNYFAQCVETGSVFYFGEDVDIYEDGEIVSHDGAWLAGVDGAEPGIIMPGTVLVGSRYFQEVAEGIALDRAEHEALGVTVETEAGTFEDCLYVVETSPLEPGEESEKWYAPGIGLINDDGAELVEYTDPSAP